MNIKNVAVAALVFIIIFIVYFCATIYFYPNLLTEARFQDLFAGITAFFSGLAFLGVVVAILLQKEELGLQRKELELTRMELTRSAEAQEKSQRALFKQAESLRLTAKLNGFSSLLQLYIARRDVGIAKYGHGGVEKQWDDKASQVAAEIESIIDQK